MAVALSRTLRARGLAQLVGTQGAAVQHRIRSASGSLQELDAPVEIAMMHPAEEAFALSQRPESWPRTVEVAEGGRRFSCPDYPNPIRHSLMDPDPYTLHQAQRASQQHQQTRK